MFKSVQSRLKQVMAGSESVKVTTVQISQVYMERQNSIARACEAMPGTAKRRGESDAAIIFESMAATGATFIHVAGYDAYASAFSTGQHLLL